jgi:hypothetical protein
VRIADVGEVANRNRGSNRPAHFLQRDRHCIKFIINRVIGDRPEAGKICRPFDRPCAKYDVLIAGKSFEASLQDERATCFIEVPSLVQLIALIKELLNRPVKKVYRPAFDVPVSVLANDFARRELGWILVVGLREDDSNDRLDAKSIKILPSICLGNFDWASLIQMSFVGRPAAQARATLVVFPIFSQRYFTGLERMVFILLRLLFRRSILFFSPSNSSFNNLVSSS